MAGEETVQIRVSMTEVRRLRLTLEQTEAGLVDARKREDELQSLEAGIIPHGGGSSLGFRV